MTNERDILNQVASQIMPGSTVRDPQAFTQFLQSKQSEFRNFQVGLETTAIEGKIKQFGGQPIPLPLNSSPDDRFFERQRQLSTLDPQIREQSRQEFGRIFAGLIGAPAIAANPLIGSAFIAGSNALSGNGIDASIIPPSVGTGAFDEAIRQTLRPSSLAISGAIGTFGGAAAPALRGVTGAGRIPARIGATLVDPVAGAGGIPVRNAAELGIDFAAQLGAGVTGEALPENTPLPLRIAAQLGGGVLAGGGAVGLAAGGRAVAKSVREQGFRSAFDAVSPVGGASALDEGVTPRGRPKFDEATEAELRQVAARAAAQGPLDPQATNLVRNAVIPPSPQNVRAAFGSQLGLKDIQGIQSRSVIGTTDALVASEPARTKLKFVIDTFARPIARQAAKENSDVFKQRLAAGLNAAKSAESRGDFQGAARIQAAAQRGQRVSDVQFQPLARLEDADNPFSDVIGFGEPTRIPNEVGGLDLVGVDELLSTEDIRQLHGQIRNHFQLKGLPQSGVNAQFALNKALLGQRLIPSEIRLLEESLGIGNRLRNLGRSKTTAVLDILAIPKTLRSAIDMSGFLRQAGIYTINLKNLSPSANGVARRKTIKDSLGIMFRAYKSKDKVAIEAWDDITTRDPKLFEALTQNPQGRKLHLYSPAEQDLSIRDEAFMSTMFTRMAGLNIREGSIPGRIARLPLKILGELVERSEVSFTAMLNRIRYDAMEQLVNDAKRNGHVVIDSGGSVVNQPFLDDTVNWVNITTGRGNLGKAEGFAPLLNGVLWAPRLATARAEFLVRGPSRVARETTRIAKTGDVLGRNLTAQQLATRRTAEEFVGFLGAGMTILSAGVLARQSGVPGFEDFTVELDPRSSDFGKGKFGTTRFDFWGGNQQFIRTLAQLATGQRKNLESGSIQEANFALTNFQFARSKLAPGIPTLATNELARGTFLGEDLSEPSSAFATERVSGGEPLGFIEQGRDALIPGGGGGSVRTRDIVQQGIPLTMFEYLDVMRERGMLEGAVFAIPPFFGAGAQTFGEQTTTSQNSPGNVDFGFTP